MDLFPSNKQVNGCKQPRVRFAPAAAAALTAAMLVPQIRAADAQPPIRDLYIVHFSHTDFGFTDLQSVCRELQRRYLDAALDAVLATLDGPADRRFFWTAESTVAVEDWWAVAPPPRREAFLRAVRSGQLEVAAMPFNQTPFLDAMQWQTMLHWLPEELWNELRPRVAVQNDVNGLPRAGAVALLDRGVQHLFMGINADSGGPPFYRPSAFWWKMPDGRRLFVWLNHSYPAGFDFFETYEWRRGPVPRAGDMQFRPPRGTDVFRTDEASLRAAQAQCLRRIDQIKAEGYPHDVLTISVTSQWRMDNDPPFPHLAEFVAAWNKLGLKPVLHFVTASQAVRAMEQAVGDKAPEHEGEFTDWWANGTASAPREVAASRVAKRLLAAAESPLWGDLAPQARRRIEALRKDLCLFDEHTWGSSMSVALPWSLDSQAQFAEKALFAYRPMAHAEWLLSQRARSKLLSEGEGLYVANTSNAPFSGWVRLNATSLRGDFQSLAPAAGGARLPLEFEPGISPWHRPARPEDLSRENDPATHADNVPRRVAKFWVEAQPTESISRWKLRTEPVEGRPASVPAPEVKRDADGWPESARWPGMEQPLFTQGTGDFLAVQVDAFAPRQALMDICYAADDKAREKLRRERLKEVRAESEQPATVEETPHTLVFTQWLRHPRLRWCVRRLELWKREPRARMTLRFDRISSDAPEILFASFRMPCEGVLPRLSSGGMAFTPFTDQIPGSCRDYFGIDGWAWYPSTESNWLWVSHDAPLVSLGGPQVWARRSAPPAEPNRIDAMLFNNCWHTNFVGNQHGVMEFRFDLAWRKQLEGPRQARDLAESLTAEPVILINGPGGDDRFLMERLFTP